jgi:hypothetical protein
MDPSRWSAGQRLLVLASAAEHLREHLAPLALAQSLPKRHSRPDARGVRPEQ